MLWLHFFLHHVTCILQLIIVVKLHSHTPGRLAQSVKRLATDASLTADPGVASLILARSHTFLETDHEIISMAILLPSVEELLSVTSESMCTEYW